MSQTPLHTLFLKPPALPMPGIPAARTGGCRIWTPRGIVGSARAKACTTGFTTRRCPAREKLALHFAPTMVKH